MDACKRGARLLYIPKENSRLAGDEEERLGKSKGGKRQRINLARIYEQGVFTRSFARSNDERWRANGEERRG